MVDFKKLDVSELKMILKSVEGTKMELQIKRELDRRKRIAMYSIQEQFASSYVPEFNSDYMFKCRQLSMDFDVMRLPYLWKSTCFDAAGNLEGDFYIGMFGKDKSEIDKKWMHNLGYLSLIFADEELACNYEGTYNTVNYLINSIYRNIARHDGVVDSVNTLFLDMPEKEAIVTDKFVEVVEYLWDVRNHVMDSRSSIGNHGLTANKNKIKSHISPQQRALIEAVSFGCSIDELKEGDYEGAKKLIYVPRQKIKR